MNWYDTNWRGGWALIRGTWLTWLQYPSFFFLLAFGWMVAPLISLFVWYTITEGGPINGLTQGAFVAYYLIFILVNQLTYSQTNWTVGDNVRTGGISTQLLQPLPSLFHVIGTEVAGKVVYMTFVIPVAVLLALFLRPELHPEPLQIVLFFPALLFAWLLRFFWGLWLALLAFWTTRAEALLGLQDSLVFLLAGQVAPIALLPGPLQTLAQILPFRYMVSFPVEVLTMRLSPSELGLGFAYQVGWLMIAFLLYRILWINGLKHYTAVGG